MKILKIVGQLIAGSLILFLGILIIYEKIPGNGAVCDAGQIYLFYMWMIFLISSILFLINSIIFYKIKNWVNYRKIAILITFILLLLSISFRWIFINLYYGNELYTIKSDGEKGLYITIRLYENNKFFADTYDCSCETENTGTYIMSDEKLELNYKNEKSNYTGIKYIIDNQNIKCDDCEVETNLIMVKHR